MDTYYQLHLMQYEDNTAYIFKNILSSITYESLEMTTWTSLSLDSNLNKDKIQDPMLVFFKTDKYCVIDWKELMSKNSTFVS